MPARSGKLPARESQEQTLVTQLERTVFGDFPTNTDGQLSEPELWWSEHYHWLKDSGYLLRPRYAPDWIPSWQGTKKSFILCEDSRVARVGTRRVGRRLASLISQKLIVRYQDPRWYACFGWRICYAQASQ